MCECMYICYACAKFVYLLLYVICNRIHEYKDTARLIKYETSYTTIYGDTAKIILYNNSAVEIEFLVSQREELHDAIFELCKQL